MRIVALSCRGGEQQQHCAQPCDFVCLFNQLSSYSLPLPRLVDGEIGEVSAIVKVRDCSRDAD